MIVPPPPPADGPAFVESRIDAGSPAFEYQMVDVDGDARTDLVVAAATAGERRLRLWRQRDDAAFPAAPDWQLAVPPDVVAFTLLDLRPEPGREVLLLTRAGIYSVSPTRDGLQGNLRREAQLALLPDLPDPDRLPCWQLVADVDGDGREELLVVTERGLLVLAARERAGPDPQGLELVEIAHAGIQERGGRPSRGSLRFGSDGVEAERGQVGAGPSFFPGARTSRPAIAGEHLLQRSRSIRFPRLLDFDGDGRLETLERTGDLWSARTLVPAGAALEGRLELPPAARDADERRFVDVDGDGRRELVTFETDADEKAAAVFAIAGVAGRPLDGRVEESPRARVKLAAMSVDFHLVDVDRDGLLDLAARTIDVPTGLATLATVRLDAALHLFRGGPGGTWSRAPEFSFERRYKPEQLARVQESLLLTLHGDFDGDALHDLVSTQLDGRVEIRAVRRDGARLALAAEPFASFQPSAPVTRIETWDLGGDGVSDLLLRHETGFTLFVSRGGRR